MPSPTFESQSGRYRSGHWQRIAVMRWIVAAVLLFAGALVATGSSSSLVVAADATSSYVPINPTRLVDTRSGTAVQANVARDFQITGAAVPATATAVVLNVTATGSTGNGFLQVFPTGQATQGSSSTLNLDFAGQTIPNAAFAPLGSGGKVSVFSTFTTHVLIDVFGYFVPAATATSGRLVSLTPTRILDTRIGLGWTPPTTPPPTTPPNPGDSKNCSDFATYAEAKAWFDTYFPFYGDIAGLDADGDGIPCQSLPGAPKLTAQNLVDGGTTISLQVAGRGGVPSSGASAVVMNVTVAGPTAAGFVQVAPSPVSKGAFSNLNPEPGRTIANLVVVPLGVGGKVDLYAELYSPGTLDLLADVVGYFTDNTAADSTTGLFVPITPTRALDTRQPAPQPEVVSGATVDVSTAAVAPGASAIAGNLTSTGGGPGGFLQLAATPVNPGASSSLNTSYEGQTIANAVVSPVAAGGAAQVYSFGSTHILLDVTGWFTGGEALVEITIADFAFVGAQQVPAGGRVVVTNTDPASHTWTAVDGSFDSGTLTQGESFEFTFDEPGTFEYFCKLHPSMTGTIKVTG